MRTMLLVLISLLGPAIGNAAEFKCYVGPLIGGSGTSITFSEEATTRAVAEDFSIGCGILKTESVVFCLLGNSAASTAFMTMTEDELTESRTDVNDEWVQADIGAKTLYGKFLDGRGLSATGMYISCQKK